MYEFGEILTLAICVVAAVYVLTNRRRIGQLQSLRPFVFPFMLALVGWIATVVEGIPQGGPGLPTLVFWTSSPGVVAAGGSFGEVFNALEHVCLAASGVWLLVVLWRGRGAAQEGSP
jgi:hypothetical protein